MISLRKYFDSTTVSGGAYAEGFGRAWSILAGKLLAAVIGEVLTDEHPRLAPYAGQMKNVHSRTVAAASIAEIDSAGDEAASLLREFRRLRDEVVATDSAHLQKLIDLLHHAVATLSDGGQRSVARLNRVQQDLARSTKMNDIQALKACLGECLKYVKQESALEKENAERTVSALKGELAKVTEALPPPRSSLPGRNQAESAIREAAALPGVNAVAIFVLDRFSQVSERFGAPLCERILAIVVEDISKHLTQARKIYRWNDHALAIEFRTEADWNVISGIARNVFDAMPRERRVDVGQRTAVLQLPHRWTLFRCSDQDVLGRIETFVNV